VNPLSHIKRTKSGHTDQRANDCFDLRLRWTLSAAIGVRAFKITLVPLLLVAAFMSLSATVTVAADGDLLISSAILSQTEPTAPVPEKEEHGLSQKAEEIARFANFSITNSIVVTWIVALGLIVLAVLRPET